MTVIESEEEIAAWVRNELECAKDRGDVERLTQLMHEIVRWQRLRELRQRQRVSSRRRNGISK